MQAFHNDPAIKERYVARMKQHIAKDHLVRGIYWDGWRGCAIGCTVETSQNVHEKIESELNIPRQLTYLEDYLFENISSDHYSNFALEFLEAIPTGADLALVIPRFLTWLLVDPEKGVNRFADERGKHVCEIVAGLYRRIVEGETIIYDEWRDARADADADARAADADARADASRASRAAAAAAAAAAYADASSAYADADADAAYAAYADATTNQAEKLLELLREA